MNDNLKTTYRFLARSRNLAALELLIAGLGSTYPETRRGSVHAILERPNTEGHCEVFRRLGKLDKSCQAIVQERTDRLVSAAGVAIQGEDSAARLSACEAVLAYHLYEVSGALTKMLCQAKCPDADRLASTLLQLAELFYGELTIPQAQRRRKNTDTVRQNLTIQLEGAARKYSSHRREEVLEAFLLVCKPQNSTFRTLLLPNDPACSAVTKILKESPRGGVMRLVLGMLEDPAMPVAIRRILGIRSDVKFVENLLTTIGPKPSKATAENLVKLESVAWAVPGFGLIQQLSDEAQACAVGFLTTTAIERRALLALLSEMLQECRPEGRRAAAEALAQFEGAEANSLAVRSLNDEDPIVRAHLIRQLRPRKIPGTLSLLVRMLDTEDENVRAALREALPEFSLDHYLDNFMSLDEDHRAAVGQMVRRLSHNPASRLAAEMRRLSPVRRRRAVAASESMALVAELETTIISLLSDEDHVVRAEAARALATCNSQPSWGALRDALFDRSYAVKEAAEQSLERISQMLNQAPESVPDLDESEQVQA